MPTARLCPLAAVASRLPPDCWIAERLEQDSGALAEEAVLWITGDVHWHELHLDAPLASGSPLRSWLDGLSEPPSGSPLPRAPFLILVDGHLQIDGALTSSDTDGTTHLIVTGNAQVHNAVIGGQLVCVQGALRVQDLLWGHYNHGELRVHGGLQARVALFTDEYHLHIEGPEQVEFLLDEVRPAPHLAEFSSEVLGAVFAPEFHSGVDAGEDGLAALLDRRQVVAAVRAGDSAVHGSADIQAAWPLAHDLCADNAISVQNILAVVHTPVIAHKEHKAYGWFGQTDFSICQRHVDEDGDQRDDNVFITVWKTWDFYLSVEQVPPAHGPLQRLAAAVLRRSVPTTPQLTLLYRRYNQGEPGEWQALAEGTDPEAWQACQTAWRGVLDYVRKAVGQHRARYPLYQRLVATLTAEHIERFTSLPVFTDQYNDWWDSDRNGWWEGNIWVGARQPCMHEGEPWGRALKLSWRNGDEAPGDDEDNAHSAYQINVDEAREGPALVEFAYAQRQSDSRAPLPRGAADHITRLLRFYGAVEARIRTQAEQDAARQAEARRIKAAVQLLATPPLAADVPDVAVFPLELMELSARWQADGQAYVATVRAHQLAQDMPEPTAGDAAETDDGSDDEAEEESTLPPDPRQAAAPTVLQLARVVHQHADVDLGERFRQRFAFAPDAFVQRAANAGCFIGPVITLDDGRVLARVGAAYDDTAHWVAVQGPHHQPLPALRGLGRSPNRRIFAQSDGQQLTTHQGFGGPMIARFALPRGNEGLPPHMPVAPGPLGQRCDELIPFNNGQRVLLRNPTGIYLLTPAANGGSKDGDGVQRLHPQTFDEDGPYTWRKNQMDEEAGGQAVTVLALDMLHMALSPDERHIAVGDQDSSHILLDAQGTLVAEYDPQSSYPHHTAFSHDGTRLFANSCHLYWGSTLSVPLSPLAAQGPQDAPQHAPTDAEDLPTLDDRCRVYASATQPGLVVLGDADGYLHAIGDDGQALWRHHIGSTISGMDMAPDGGVLWAASYGGYLVRLERSEAGMDPYSIGTSPYVETSRWIFWSDEAGPLRW
ncbi:WD40 repeat domain-containing protein [Acidovorax sp. FJL06]|uniref:WD40 repeat domain-containing protein n=1 Tax=Acidovorax sp. FJL06 TaxID=2153365 RepID=UPI000F585FD3|nr:WD40 repeat domain-containing protein [Acidovorax sp. FJL06]RQO80753.1 hypothetical protein DBV10_17910 [Acidovorax sp. FJL06]